MYLFFSEVVLHRSKITTVCQLISGGKILSQIKHLPEKVTSFWIGLDWSSECTPKASALFTHTLYTLSASSPVTVWAVISRFTLTLCGPGPQISHEHRHKPIQSDIFIYLK